VYYYNNTVGGENVIFIDPRGGKPLFEQIKDTLREQMLSGIWNPHDKLPSVRELAQSAAINPNTIQKAYRDLEAEGFIYAVAGRGCYAAETPPAAVERRRRELIEKLHPLIRELRISGIPLDEMTGLVKQAYERTETA
jgi:GntR family transcriptional regulator